jgi:hypothetical protein
MIVKVMNIITKYDAPYVSRKRGERIWLTLQNFVALPKHHQRCLFNDLQ